MNKQEKRIKKFDKCVICKTNPKRSDTAETCNQSCAGKLAWQTRLS